MTCPICGSTEITVAEVGYPVFRQTDFATVRTTGRIGECRSCQALFQRVAPSEVHSIEQQLEEESYVQSGQTSQTVTVKEFASPVTRSFLQAELLRCVIRDEAPVVLDIGCFDGELLIELDAHFATAELHGFDSNEHLRRLFPSKDNFHFWTEDLGAIDGPFDLICLSHCMAYVRDVRSLMCDIDRLLKPGGVLFLQMPDISANPCYLLMGDQFYYYTPSILRSILGLFGFKFSPLQNEWFPREIVGLARPGRAAATATGAYGLRECLRDLDRKAERLRDIARRTQDAGVLGTTGSAAFVDSILGDRVSRFVDENPRRLDTTFRNKPVLHPSALRDSDAVLIPYGASGQEVRRRFAEQYRGRFIVV
jgi:SAM-dependent methyltransferase